MITIGERIRRLGLTCDVTIDGKVRHFHNGHEYIEIGGMRWATMNVGAEKVTDYGLYFQCGDTKGYTADQVGGGEGEKYFGWEDYKHGNGSMTKYNSTDGKTVLDASDDAVTVNWGDAWRMPTTKELVTLGNAVFTTWTNDYQGSGVSGLVLTDKTDSSKVLFFPAGGRCYNGSVFNVGRDGYYWSSSHLSSDIQYGRGMYFYRGGVRWRDYYCRYRGFAVRGIIN